MRTPVEALKELRDRLTYFCARLDGKYNPPWAQELVGIIDDAVDGADLGSPSIGDTCHITEGWNVTITAVTLRSSGQVEYQLERKGTQMKVDTDTFYVVAYTGGGFRNPTFVKDIGTGYTDSWGSADSAERFDTRKDAAKFIRKHYPDSGQYQPMRVRVDVRLYN